MEAADRIVSVFLEYLVRGLWTAVAAAFGLLRLLWRLVVRRGEER